MTTEEKAKAYDEAIERAIEWYNNPNSSNIGKAYLYAVFPELKESEDERIRKWLEELIEAMPDNSIEFNDVKRIDVLHWLEKGEQKLTLPKWKYKKDHTPLLRDSIILNKYGSVTKSPFGAIVSDVWVLDYDELSKLPKEEIEKQGEQKTVDKIEPKFKVGDWIIDKQGIVHQIERIIENVTNHTFGYDIVGGGYFNDSIEGVRSWTITDAKEGDVLFLDVIGGFTFVFKGITSQGNILYSFLINNNDDNTLSYNVGKVNIGIGNVADTGRHIYPATKEQCDLLLQKMKDAGYEYDVEKKELRKMEQKPKWSEDDEKNWCGIIDEIKANKSNAPDYDIETYDRFLSWMHNIKQRMEEQQ